MLSHTYGGPAKRMYTRLTGGNMNRELRVHRQGRARLRAIPALALFVSVSIAAAFMAPGSDSTPALASHTASPASPEIACTSFGFGAATNFAAGTSPQSVAIGDFNRNGNLDLAVANEGSANVSVLLGNGTGGFGV